MNLIEELERQSQISSKRQTRGAILKQITQIWDGFEDYFTVSHLLHTLINKNGDSQDPYDWEDEKLLKKAEQMYKKMIKEIQEEKYATR